MTQELRKLAEAATQGEWKWDGNVCDYDPYNESPWLVDAKDSYPPILGGQIKCTNTANAAFIAAANPAAILALLDRVEKAEKDAARLDWLEKHDKRYYNYDKISCIVGNGFSHGYISEGVNSTLRGAIDSAMEASK